MPRNLSLLVASAVACALALSCRDRSVTQSGSGAEIVHPAPSAPSIELPKPRLTGPMSLEETIARRRSVREFAPGDLTLEELGQLCWAAQGITEAGGRFRAAPSAGALYPLEVYACVRTGVYRYESEGHRLERTVDGDHRESVEVAALGQEFIDQAACVFALTGVVERTRVKYGDRAERYVWMEAGHAAQNLLLQAVSLGLGAVVVGAFDDADLAEVLDLAEGESPLYLIPVGRRK